MEMLAEQISCEVCESKELVHDDVNGEIVCARCGLVRTADILNKGPEWRAFTLSESATRERGHPASPLSYNGGLFTGFNSKKDSKGAWLTPEIMQKWKRLRRFDFRTRTDDNKIRNFDQAMTEMERYSDRLNLPSNVRDMTSSLYRKALRRDLLRGRTISDFVAAAIYASCRLLKIPRSLSEVSEASGRSVKDVSRTYRLLVKEFGLRMPVDDPMKFIPKIASSLHISLDSDKKAIEILQEASKQRIVVGKDPRSLAASALYIACKSNGEKITQKRIANAVGVSTVSMRNRLRELEVLLK
jgi:transcription initiation factor TFIIB